jgi:hypothetical protein
MKYGLFAAVLFGLVALMGGTASAAVATGGLTKANVAPAAASVVEEAGWRSKCKKRCYRRCRAHGGSWWGCKKRCSRRCRRH